jgi:hypothetical protein
MHSESCPHRRLASSVIEEDCFLHEEDLLTVDAAGETLIHTAARWGASLDLISFLLSRLNKPDVTNFRGETFVHLLRPSQTRGFWEVFPRLLADILNRGFNPELVDCEGRCCLTRLINDLETSADPALFKYEVVDTLLTDRFTLLQYFLHCKETGGSVMSNMINTLKNIEGDLRKEGHYAQAGGALYHTRNIESMPSTPRLPPKSVRELTEAEAENPNQFDVDGKTSLMALVCELSTSPPTANRNKGIMRLEAILSSTPNLRLQDRDGNTVLHQAIAQASPAVVRTLVKYGADPRLRNLTGQSGLEMAEELLAKERRFSLAFAHRLMVLVALKRAHRRSK